MRIKVFLGTAALTVLVAGASGVVTGAAQAAGHGPATRVAPCATVKVRATPVINTAMIPETIKSHVTNCASVTETVVLAQNISGPASARAAGARKWKITLSAGQTVTKVRHFPYACCGSYTVHDKVSTTSGRQLAKASAGFTFA